MQIMNVVNSLRVPTQSGKAKLHPNVERPDCVRLPPTEYDGGPFPCIEMSLPHVPRVLRVEEPSAPSRSIVSRFSRALESADCITLHPSFSFFCVYMIENLILQHFLLHYIHACECILCTVIIHLERYFHWKNCIWADIHHCLTDFDM